LEIRLENQRRWQSGGDRETEGFMNADTMTIEILPDGTIKTTTDPVSPANHDSAERFIKAMSILAAGKTTRAARTDSAAMARAKHHGHDHAHDHGQDVLKAGH
jgi:hypothetical protein